MQRVAIIIAAMCAMLCQPVWARDTGSADWTVSQQSGSAQILRNGTQPIVLAARETAKPGDVIATGADGRVVLTRAGDYIVIAPGSRLLLPKLPEPSGFTRLVQQFGTMLYKVRHTGVPHFAVETPMLAAVVKGTSFTVIVGPDRSAVQVTDGIVDVTASVGGLNRLVQKGETVFINRDRPSELIELSSDVTVGPTADEKEPAVRVSANTVSELTPIAVLTEGLAREVPAQTAAPSRAEVQTVKLAVRDTSSPASVAAAPTTLVAETVTTAAPATTPVSTAQPTATVSTVTTPAVTAPAVTVSAVTTPTVTTPAVTAPAVTTPTVVVPAFTVPKVTVPAIPLPPLKLSL